MTVAPLSRGAIVWVDLNPSRGSEQAGSRPAVVISSDGYLANVPHLAIVVPITTTDRGWPHHVPIAGTRTGLNRTSFAMTEQPRTISRERIDRRVGTASSTCLQEIDQCLRDFTRL